MPVPPASALRPGVAVNIILKADQPTGKLTSGKIQDLLSSGDHPRGIKVRLQDGQIGRVQSLAASGSATSSASNVNQSTVPVRQKQYRFQEDYRNSPEPPSQERSLDEYIKVKPTKRRKGKVAESTSANNEASESRAEEDLQKALQTEFPTLDSALIAAIMNDSDDLESAKSTLQALTIP